MDGEKCRNVEATPGSHGPALRGRVPVFERSFIRDSYANRRGKGTHRALDRCQEFARRFPYVLQLDLRQFFPSVDHSILRDLLARKVLDVSVLWLIELILASGEGVLSEAYDMVYFPGDDLFAINRPRGLPAIKEVLRLHPTRRKGAWISSSSPTP